MKFFLLGLLAICLSAAAADPMPLSEVVSHITLPPGFHATLCAGEPMVRQPIAMTFDDRGRLWVVENYTYMGSGTDGFDTNRRDRILIFEDTTGSGHFDKRTVFWNQGVRLTGIAVGFGGVFCSCAPNLIFIPDRNGDDVPDGPPEILLDGWNSTEMHHTIFNGLKWGPDGWLYGREGIVAVSAVGKPGAAKESRIRFDCGIWRYHPTRKSFEVVCRGTTNPWGHDWDKYGELFFINTVIGHLWHAIPGAFYRRMFGEDQIPYRYDLIDQTADHYHWDNGRPWTEARGGASSDSLGGGHAHTGLMIYQGDNWPAEYRDHIFTINFHGRRINQDLPERKGSGYVAHHGTDLVKFGDPWFQGIDLDYGPDGAVTVLDWSDTGECHGNDGVHRETGRIYKIAYGDVSRMTNNLAAESNEKLLERQSESNEWQARHARRILQERAAALPDSFREEIRRRYDGETNVPMKLRLFFTLHSINGDSVDWLKQQTSAKDEHVRAWAIRFLGDDPSVNWDDLVPLFAKMAVSDPSALVRLYLTSALQRMPDSLREMVAAPLLQHGGDASDHNLPLMLWYGVEPMVARYPDAAIRLATGSKIPLVRRFISRRLGEEISRDPKSIDGLLQAATQNQSDVLQGLSEALQGRHGLPKPAAWDSFRANLAPTAVPLARKVGIVFGDPWALQQLSDTAFDSKATADVRRTALQQIIDAKPPNLPHILERCLRDPPTASVAAHGLLLLGDPNAAPWALQQWNQIDSADQAALAGMMANRPASANLLLDAIAAGNVPRAALSAFSARQIANLNQAGLNAKLSQVWGEVRSSDAEKLQLIAKYRALLTPDRLKHSDLSRGREVFNRTCAVCHKLYSEGAAIGPNLTGSGRANLNYLLENIADPSAIVPADYRVNEVMLKDGRELTALVVARTDHSLTLQTPTEKFTVERNEVASIRQTKLSLMPEGLLQGLKEDEICNLIGYLMSPTQAPLPSR